MSNLIHQLIDEAASATPDRQAIGFRDQTLSYAELATASSKLANVLAEQGVSKGDRVGIYMQKRTESAIAIYGIMKAGAAYVPIDPALPPSRFRKLVNNCGMRHLVSAPDKTRALLKASLEDTSIECLVGLEDQTELPFRTIPWEAVQSADTSNSTHGSIGGDSLAYIMYTSGSTGEPKGIMHTHHSGLSFAKWAANEYGFRRDDRLTNHAPLHFDLSTMDYFAAAAAGATTVIVPEEYTKLPVSYATLLETQAISVFYTVPFALIQLLLRGELASRNLQRLRWIIFGGEPFPTPHLRSLMRELPHVQFDNIYGPAEVNGCTHYTIPSADDLNESVPIGPIAQIAQALIVDENDHAVRQGDPGELLVCTPTMMQGYWQSPELNAAAFYRLDSTGDIYYRTGDIVRERPDGIFDFLGRKDRQIKVRGFRVELDEVESAMAAIAGVEEAAAFVIEDCAGNKSIQGAVTLKEIDAFSGTDVIAQTKQHLPWYAVPTAVRIHNSFPRTSTGKIDRRDLQRRAQAAL